jgi:hypothetical protein
MQYMWTVINGEVIVVGHWEDDGTFVRTYEEED